MTEPGPLKSLELVPVFVGDAITSVQAKFRDSPGLVVSLSTAAALELAYAINMLLSFKSAKEYEAFSNTVYLEAE